MLHREPAAGSRESALYFVGNQQHPLRIAQFAQSTQELRRRDVEPAFALHRLDDDRRDARGIDVGLEQPLDAGERVVDARAVQIDRKRRVVDLGRKRTEAGLVRRHFAGERHREHRASVKRARKRDDAAAAGRCARDLDRVFDCLCARRKEDGLFGERARCQAIHLFGQLDVSGIRHHLPASMREPRKLCFDGADDFGMAMPGVEHADAAGEIDVALAFHVPDLGILGARRKYLRHHADAARGCLLLAALPLLVEIQSIHDGLEPG